MLCTEKGAPKTLVKWHPNLKLVILTLFSHPNSIDIILTRLYCIITRDFYAVSLKEGVLTSIVGNTM